MIFLFIKRNMHALGSKPIFLLTHKAWQQTTPYFKKTKGFSFNKKVSYMETSL